MTAASLATNLAPSPAPPGLPFYRSAVSGMGSRMDSPGGAMRGSEEGRRLAGTLAAVAAGSQAAMADLYARTSAKLYGICLRVLRDEGEAEEALQETYVTVWRKASAYDRNRASPIAWLAVLARNKAIDRLRGRALLPTEDIGAAEVVEDGGASAFDIVDAERERTRITRCLDELDPRQQAAIRSAFYEGASYPELAEREGVPLPTMKSWVRRGLLRLKGCLER